jgi:hypothetical protein
MPFDDFIFGGSFSKKTIYRYLPAENLRCGTPYLLKGHGKGKIERIYALDGRVIIDASTAVPSRDTRMIEVRLENGQLKMVAPLQTNPRRPDELTNTKTSPQHASKQVVILAGYTGVWLRRG